MATESNMEKIHHQVLDAIGADSNNVQLIASSIVLNPAFLQTLVKPDEHERLENCPVIFMLFL